MLLWNNIKYIPSAYHDGCLPAMTGCRGNVMWQGVGFVITQGGSSWICGEKILLRAMGDCAAAVLQSASEEWLFWTKAPWGK